MIDENQHIFIVGMPRSGSTLLESILSMKSNVSALGETNLLEEVYSEWKTKINQTSHVSLSNIYSSKISVSNAKLITTNKQLFNYQYTGIILNQFPNAQIINCFRNPLDNLLSIYRANFENGNYYSSSLTDSAYVYLDYDNTMDEYKKYYQTKIYDLNYDLLVSNSRNILIDLISWLGWDWDDSFLSPHLNRRSISTASSIEVRSPINNQSLGGWRNYCDLLRPVRDIIITKDKYKDLYLDK